MKTITQVIYDPAARRLMYMRDGANIGGMQGAAAERQYLMLLENDTETKTVIMSNKKTLVRRLRALWIKQGIDHQREAIIAPYGVSSTADLNEEQLNELINRFTKPRDTPEQLRRNRSTAIMLLQRLGIYENNGDWQKVNNYLLNKRIAGKLLYQMNVEELQALARKLRQIAAKQTNELPSINPN